MSSFNDQELVLLTVNVLAMVCGLACMRSRQNDFTDKNGEGLRWAEWMFGTSIAGSIAVFIAAAYCNVTVPPLLFAIGLGCFPLTAVVSYCLQKRWDGWTGPQVISFLLSVNALALLIDSTTR